MLIAIAETFDIRSIFYYAIGGAAIGLFAYYGSDISVALENTTDLPPVAFSLQLVAAAASSAASSIGWSRAATPGAGRIRWPRSDLIAAREQKP